MQLGYDLLRGQQFFRKALTESVYWFIQLRWIAAGVTLSAFWAVYFFLEQRIPILPLTIILLFIVLYNILFLLVWRRLKSLKPPAVKPFIIFAHVQISLDLIALFFLIYFTGGVYSPLLIFVIFHIILAGILLSPVSCFVYGIAVLIATSVLIVLQKTALLHQASLFQSTLSPYASQYPGILVLYLTLTAAILISAFLVTSVQQSLRSEGREFLKVSENLDATNAKLTALYDMVKEMVICSDLNELMNSAARNAARIMGVKACSIKLLDDQRKSLRFASTYGLSGDYLAKESINIEKSPINRKIIQGSAYAIGKIDQKDYFQYPEDIQKEGIASLMCLPLQVEKNVLGVFCVYSNMSNYFDDSDVKFFTLMTELTALSMENLRSGLAKSWFILKAAHQLRSPLNAIYSMLKLGSDGYLGQTSEKLKETLLRCQKRILTLGILINDLLKLGEKRTETRKLAIYPVDLTKIITQSVDLYQTRASEKGLNIRFHIQNTIPKISANERLVDELFTNLISNAIKYTPQGGKIEISLSKEGQDQVRLEVSDTGIGISEKEIQHLFTEFFRTENAKAVEEEGTGLGLVIIKEILNRLGGTIQIESKVGRGSRFICLFPSLPQP